MAMTFSSMTKQNFFSQSATFGLFALDNNYATGGYVIRPKDVQLKSISKIIPVGNPGGYSYVWDASNSKLLVYGGSSHTHDNDGFTNSSVLSTIRMYLATVVGTPAAADTVTGAGSGATANVVAYVGDAGYITVNGVAGGPFTTGENLTFAPSGATATLRGNLVDAWTFIPSLDANDIIVACSNQNGDGLTRAAAVFATTQDLATNQYRFYQTLASLETNNADGWTGVNIEGAKSPGEANALGSIGTEVPNGTNLAAITNCQFIAIGN